MDGKKRCVIVHHADFDNGAKGIAEAKEFAEMLISGQTEMIELAAQHHPPDVVAKMKTFLNSLQVIVRKIPEELI